MVELLMIGSFVSPRGRCAALSLAKIVDTHYAIDLAERKDWKRAREIVED